MKKVLGLILLVSSLALASDSPKDILEDKVEANLQQVFQGELRADYDVDIHKNYVEVEMEIKGEKVPVLADLKKINEQLVSTIKKDIPNKKVKVTIEIDNLDENDKVIYQNEQ